MLITYLSIPLWGLLFVRNCITVRNRVKVIELIRDVNIERIGKGLPVYNYDYFLCGTVRGYAANLFDLTKWSFKQFCPPELRQYIKKGEAHG